MRMQRYFTQQAGGSCYVVGRGRCSCVLRALCVLKNWTAASMGVVALGSRSSGGDVL